VQQSRPFDAVLFDWRGTLVHDPPYEWWLREAARRLGRQGDLASLVEALHGAAAHPDVVAGEQTCDCSPDGHRAWSMSWFARAGLDDELAECLYALDFDAGCHPFYPDAARVVRALHDADVRIALVSDIHLDLRPEFAAAGLAECFDAFVLSFEHGVQKPDRAMFEIALRELDVEAERALMVGDRASHDGGAAAVGITTLVLPPPPPTPSTRGLNAVLALAGVSVH
jgi:HAD superfamily hydrolase (TIGR01509 family)